MSAADNQVEIHRGLKGVYFDRSPVAFIDGQAGELRYRGYSIHDLAQHSSFEETGYLLFYGELPNADQLAQFKADLVAARGLPSFIFDIIKNVDPKLYFHPSKNNRFEV